MPQFLFSSLYGELTRNVQVRFDKASELHKRLFDNVIFEKYLDWDVPTIGLDFEELIGKYNITVAAPTIGDESKEAILGSEGLETVKERILNHALTLPMTIQNYRKILQILDSKSLPDSAKNEQLIKLMWGDVTTVVNAVLAKLDILFLRPLSNEGKVEIDDNINPEGGVRGTIDFNQPAENIASSKTEWTDGNIETVDCFEDIQAIIDAAQDKVTFSKVLCSTSRISYMCRSKKMKQMIWGTDKSSKMVQLKDINAYMEENSYPIFEPIRRQVRIQKGTQRIPYTPWNEKNMVFIPDGKLGIVKNAWSNNELKPEQGVAYSNYGRIRVSQWGVGESQGSNGVEFTKAESLSLPVITEMNGIYTLKTQQ
uniref:Capsid protein n=1 Tax=Myoviridae sp. ctiX384 TaxID=2827702 RepID=A0A8S5TBB0_9CAUD|nr:MAG TPA: capsid protein [Myoviridae sp. ctiX384]